MLHSNIVPLLSYSILLLRNLSKYEGISHVQEEMGTGEDCAGALKSGSPWVRSGVATLCTFVAELQCVGPLLVGGGGIGGFLFSLVRVQFAPK